MAFNYENYLLQELNNDKIVVLNEQLFVKNGEFDPDKIYVVTKYLTSSIEYGAETQPIQILILSEQNGLKEAKEIFETFTATHNWRSGMYNGVYVKEQYTSPVVMSNFNEASYGYRSVLYVSATLYIMGNIEDYQNLKINGIDIKPLNFTWSYQMTGNTQPISGNYIASTEKNISTFSCSLTIQSFNNYVLPNLASGVELVDSSLDHLQVPTHDGYTITATIEDGTINSIDQSTGTIYFTITQETILRWNYVSINLLSDLMKISAGQLTGNKTFRLTFSVFDTNFDYDCKIISVQMVSMPNNVPGLQIGLQR